MSPRFLILETSGRIGQVALACGMELCAVRQLDGSRRHARDLAPAVAELLVEQGWKPHDVQAVMVSHGPGSYTGLRVGIMSAKAFAYATGCVLLAIETFAAIAFQAPEEADCLDILEDAQQDHVYVQRFVCVEPNMALRPASALHIQTMAEWLARSDPPAWVSGPALRLHQSRLPATIHVTPSALWTPQPASLLRLGLDRYLAGERDDLWTLEPRYLRPSAAETQRQRQST